MRGKQDAPVRITEIDLTDKDIDASARTAAPAPAAAAALSSAKYASAVEITIVSWEKNGSKVVYFNMILIAGNREL